MRALLILVALAVLAYLPFVGGGLLTDDFVHLERLAHVRGAGDLLNAPDAFGFFRPVTQTSLYVDASLHGDAAPWFRLTNVVLQALVLAAAFLVARLVVRTDTGAALATLVFALTPKAHPIAVLWISARGEILMSAFALLATAAWIVWTRGGRPAWLGAAVAGYALAILSKETAFLLPLVLMLSPSAVRSRRSLVGGAALMIAVAAAVFLWRIESGALVPTTVDPHYSLSTPLFRWGRNARNYFWRLIPEPLALILIMAVPPLLRGRARQGSDPPSWRYSREIVTFCVAWVVAIMLPVLPVVARNELYLYLPAFGVSLLAAHVVETAAAATWQTWHARAAIIGFAAICGVYQGTRSYEFHEDLVFSDRLVDALAAMKLPRPQASVALTTGDERTRRFLDDAIGGYLPVVLRRVAPDGRLVAADAGAADTESVVRLICSYHDGRVALATRED